MTDQPSLVVWKDAYNTGIDLIDKQHRELVSTINSLYASLSKENKSSALKPAAEMVMQYTKIHFATEFKLMKDSGYPRLGEHHDQHERLISRADESLHDCLKEDGDPTDFLHFLKEWFLVHIVREDKAYSAHLLEYLANRPEEAAGAEA